MKKAIAAAAMAALVVIAGITGAFVSSSCSCILRSSRNSSDVVIYAADKWLLSPLVPLFVLYARIIIIVHRCDVGTGNLFLTESESIREYF